MSKAAWLWTAACCVALATIAAVAAWAGSRLGVDWYVGAGGIRERSSRVEPRDVLWERPRPVNAEGDAGRDEYEPRLSPDGTTLVFVRGRAG